VEFDDLTLPGRQLRESRMHLLDDRFAVLELDGGVLDRCVLIGDLELGVAVITAQPDLTPITAPSCPQMIERDVASDRKVPALHGPIGVTALHTKALAGEVGFEKGQLQEIVRRRLVAHELDEEA
jgi:hypothetical protein